MQFSFMTLGITISTTLGIMTLSIMTLSIMTLSIFTLSILTLSIMVEICYAECHLCQVSIILSVAKKLYMLSVIMLSFIMLSVVAPC
jgi:hypothetical protein